MNRNVHANFYVRTHDPVFSSLSFSIVIVRKKLFFITFTVVSTQTDKIERKFSFSFDMIAFGWMRAKKKNNSIETVTVSLNGLIFFSVDFANFLIGFV